MIFSILLCNSITVLLLRYHSAILYLNRNIFFYLNVSLIVSMSMMVNEQATSLMLRLYFGALPYQYAFVARFFIMTFTLLYFGIVLNLNMFRIVLVSKVNIS